MKTFWICFFAAMTGLGFLSLSFALDQNSDGISDVFASYYSLAAGTGSEDPDGDGQDNAHESAFGTNPLDNSSNSSTDIALLSPSLLSVSIDTMSGKKYQFTGLNGLTGSWNNIDIPFDGTGATESLLTTLPISGTDKFFWRVDAIGEVDSESDGLGAYEESLLGTSDNLKDSDSDHVSDLIEFLNGLDPTSFLDTDGDGLSDDWEDVSGTDKNDDGSIDPDNGPNGDINGDGISNREAYDNNVLGDIPIGPEELSATNPGQEYISFKPGYPADLYYDTGIEGWSAAEYDLDGFIEVWDDDPEGVFDYYFELQSHEGSDGIKQEFNMLPNSQLTFILAYKGRYDFGDTIENAFSLKVKGAADVLVNGVQAQLNGDEFTHSLMSDDDINANPLPYENWSYASVTIIAADESSSESDGAVDISLKLIPDVLTSYGEEVTYGGFVQLFQFELKVTSSNSPTTSLPEYNSTPNKGSAENLFSVWGGEYLTFSIHGLPDILPNGFIVWDVDGFTVPANATEFTFWWTSPAQPSLEIEFPPIGLTRKIHVDVPNVGAATELDVVNSNPLAAAIIAQSRSPAIEFANRFTDPQRDAMRHAYWCSRSVSTAGCSFGYMEAFGLAHEYNNKWNNAPWADIEYGYEGNGYQPAFNTTMDLHNNGIGILVYHEGLNGMPEISLIENELVQRYDNGEMYIWEIPPDAANNSAGASEGIIIKSNGNRIFN